MDDPFADIPIVGKGQAGSMPTAPSNDIPIGPNGELLDLPPNTGATNAYGGIPAKQTSEPSASVAEDPFADIPMLGKTNASSTSSPKIELEKDNPFADIPEVGKTPKELPWYKNLPLSAIAQTAAGAIQTAGGFERAGAAPVTDISGVNAPFQRGATIQEATTAFDKAIADKQSALDSIQGIVKKQGFLTAEYGNQINDLQREIGDLQAQKEQTLKLPQYTSDTQQQELIQQRQQLGKEAGALSEQAAGMFPALGVSQQDTSIAAQLGRGIGGVVDLAPAMVAGPLALPAMAVMGGSQAYGEGYDAKVQELKQQGVTDQKQLDEVGHQAGSQAAVNQVPALAAYTIGGSLTTAATSALLKGASPLVKGLVGGTAASSVNLGVSGGLRKAEGGNFLPNVEQAVPDILFGGIHGVGTGLEARAEAKKAANAELGGPAPEVAPSSNPLVNEKEAQITANADVLHETPAPTINIPAATPEELAKAGEIPTPVDNTQKLIDLATDQLEHEPGSPEHTAIQQQIDALKQPAETPVAEAQPETPNESVQIEKAREVGVRNAPAVGEGVGAENKPEVPAQEGQATKEEVKPTIPTIEPPKEKSQLELWADNTIKEGQKRLNVGLDPEVLSAYAIKGAFKIARGVRDFTAWSKEMLSEFGEAIRPHLDDLWNRANQIHNEEQITKYGPKPPSERDVYAEKLTDQLTKVLGRPPTAEEVSGKVDKKFGKAEAPAPAPVVGGEGERQGVGISKEAVNNQRLARMLESLPKSDREANVEKINNALEKNKNPNFVEGIIHDILDMGKTIATPEEVALMTVEMNRLQLERQRVQDNFEQTEKRPSDYSILNNEIKPIDDKIDRLERAVDKVGTNAGRLLQMFKIMLAEDYSPIALEKKAERQLRRELTFEEKNTIAEQAKQIKELQDKLNSKQEKAEENYLNSSVKEVYERQIAELKDQAKPDPAVQKILDKVVDALKSPADKARERIAQRRREGRLFAGIPDPTLLADVALIGAEKIAKGASNLAKWTSQMRSEFGDGIMPYIKEIWSKSLDQFNAASEKLTSKSPEKIKAKVNRAAKEEATREDIIDRAKAEAAAGDELSHATVYDLARSHILEGMRGEDNIMKAVHDDIKEAYPDATERDVRRAFSEYGKAKFPSKEEDKVQLRQLRTLVRLQESIDRLKAGLPALRSGLQRDRANQAIREKQTILNNLLKEVKVEPTPEQLTSRLEAKKNALRNRIEDLDAKLQGKAKNIEKGVPIVLDAEAERLTSLRDAMQEKLREIESQERKLKEKTPEQKEIDRLQASIDDVNDRIARGEKIAPTPKKEPLTEYAKKLKEDLKKAREQYKRVTGEEPKTPEQKYNERRIADAKKKIAEIEDKMRRGDYSKAEKRKPPLKYPETELVEKQLADKRREADLWREEKEKSERPGWERILRTASETAREVTVAGINVLYKIGKYAIAKPITTPIGEIVGYTARQLGGLGKVRGEFESGASLLKTIPAYYRGYWKAMKQFMRVLKSGHSDSELLYDKQKQNNTNWFRWIGSNLHAAIKNLPSTAKEELYREHLYANAIADGLIDPKNPSDPKNQMAIAGLNLKAYLASKAEKLQEDNKISEAINNIHRWAESPDKEGKINPYTSLTSHLVKIAITKGIYKIGLNFLKQTGQAVTGLPRGMIGLLNAHWNGLDTLTPKEMDYITKAFKVGSIPAALMAWAVIDAFKDDKDKVFGGYYEQGRKKGDVKWGDVRINGKQFSLHIPEIEAAQFVNTMARDFRKNASKTDLTMNLIESFFDAMKGVFSEAPITGPVTEIAKSPKSFAGYLIQGQVPSAVRDVAKMRDVNAEGEPNYRYTKTALDNLKKGIPGLRETLPSKPSRRSSRS